MSEELVSIIVPCYNVADTLERFLKSVLSQSYSNLQVIAVDDGSTDDTSKILSEWKQKFTDKGANLEYIYQKNAGLGAAIDKGLKFVKGKYLCWADPDDFYLPDSIRLRVNAFHDHPECGVVSSDAYVYDEKDLSKPIKCEAKRFEHRFEPNQFEYLLIEQSHFCAGCHMIRMDAFDKINPNREIYKARRGQNWQMLLPMYYAYPRYFLDKPLYAYVVYHNSMSSGDNNEEKELKRWQEHEDIIYHTLDNIPLTWEKQKKYYHLIKERYAIKRFYTAIDYRDKALLTREYNEIKEMGADNKSLHDLYLRNKYLAWKIVYKARDVIKNR